jgi:hypothetical protein
VHATISRARCVFSLERSTRLWPSTVTRKTVRRFGHDSSVDLTAGMRVLVEVYGRAAAVYGDLVITGSAIGDNRAVVMPRGAVRAFDARSGRYDGASIRSRLMPRKRASATGRQRKRSSLARRMHGRCYRSIPRVD